MNFFARVAIIVFVAAVAIGRLLFPNYVVLHIEAVPLLALGILLLLFAARVRAYKIAGLALFGLGVLSGFAQTGFQLDWPRVLLLVFSSLVFFADAWPEAARRIKEIRFGNTSITLAAEALSESTERAEQTLPTVGLRTEEPTSAPHPRALRAADTSVENQILDLAAKDKMAALVRLSVELEKELFVLHGTLGLRNKARARTWRELVDQLKEHGTISAATAHALIEFRDIRNRAVHWVRGDSPDDVVVGSTLDSGLRLLRLLQSTSRPTYTVEDPGVDLFSDKDLKVPIPGVRGVMLKVQEQNGLESFRVFPAGREFTRGEVVGWDWDMSRTVGPAWYRDSQSDKGILAWSEAAAFVGKPFGLP